MSKDKIIQFPGLSEGKTKGAGVNPLPTSPKPALAPPGQMPLAGNPNPGDPRQPSPPTMQGYDPAEPGAERVGVIGPDGTGIILTPDQHKALSHILAGTAFVFIGIKETANGADFFTALHGEPAVLRNAQDELPAVIARLYTRRGVTQ